MKLPSSMPDTTPVNADLHAIKPNPVDPNVVNDLRTVYLFVHASAIVASVPEIIEGTEVGTRSGRANRRYVMELLHVLMSVEGDDGAPLVVINEEPPHSGDPDDPHTWYQVDKTVDYHSADEAAEYFDRIMAAYVPPVKKPSKSAPRTPRNATNPADLPLCLCGCGEPVTNRKRNYRPGHDARHAGQVARELVEMMKLGTNSQARKKMLEGLPTDSLRAKAAAMADRISAKATMTRKSTTPSDARRKEVLAEESAKAKLVAGKVKVGRWSYPANRNLINDEVVYTQKGESKVADDKVAATFIADES